MKRASGKSKDWKFPASSGIVQASLNASMNSSIPVPPLANPCRRGAFTLVELLVVVAIIGILAGMLLPALAANKAKARGMVCQNNNKHLVTAWLMYADDYSQFLPFNLGGAAARNDINWAD